MRIIELHGEKWKSLLDFYDALIGALDGPEWHGRSVDALIDSIIWGGINAINPPYAIRISGIAELPAPIRDEIALVQRLLSEARAEFRVQRGYDVEVYFEIKR